jgi:putative holliday junction resolvase
MQNQEQNYEGGRLLGIDLGSKKVGLAICDELGLSSKALKTVARKNLDAELKNLLKTYTKLAGFVLGLPKSRSGDAEKQVRVFASKLQAEFALPVYLHDEKLTSWEARELLKEEGYSAKQVLELEDQKAAELILKSFLDQEKDKRPKD